MVTDPLDEIAARLAESGVLSDTFGGRRWDELTEFGRDELRGAVRDILAAPDPDTVALAAKRAGRWARDNTALTAAQIIDLDLAIRDLAGPT
jgi:hypothetical protein